MFKHICMLIVSACLAVSSIKADGWIVQTECSVSCGPGIILFGANRGTPCATSDCPVDGGWADYSPWTAVGACPVTCGGGKMQYTRTRTCTNPVPGTPNGRTCAGDGDDFSRRTCNTFTCAG